MKMFNVTKIKNYLLYGQTKKHKTGLWSRIKISIFIFPKKNNYFYCDQNENLQIWIMVGKS